MSTVTVSPKYQIILPKDVREQTDIKPGDKFEIFVTNGRIRIVRVRDIKELYGFAEGMDISNIRDEEDRI